MERVDKTIKNFQKFIELELSSIRDEYLNVKKCQHTFLIFEITATGVVLSFLLPMLLEKPESQTLFHLFLIFAPVSVIIPSLYIILDKGITLNRIAAFLLVIECTIDKFGRFPQYLKGWEVGCLLFRRKAHELKKKEENFNTGTQGPNRFYQLVYLISFVLTSICAVLFLALYLRSEFPKPSKVDDLMLQIVLYLIALAVIGLFMSRTYKIWRKVVKEEYTIYSMANLWWEILEKKEEKIILGEEII